jgi:hypothetical protein
MQQGRYVAGAVRARLQGRAVQPFRYRDKGNLATIGRASAVADLHFVRLSGFPAWVTWLVVHLWYLVGFQNRLVVFIRWSFSFATGGRGARIVTGPAADPPTISDPDRTIDGRARAAPTGAQTQASPLSPDGQKEPPWPASSSTT